MHETARGQLNRRTAVTGALVGLAGFAGLATVAGAASGGVDGVAGGGLVPLAGGSGSTQFSLAIVQVAAQSTPVLAGSFVLYDAHASGGAAILQSVALVDFKAYAADHPNARQLTGNLSVNGDGLFPFLLQVEPATTAAQKDSFNLVVGQAALPYLGNDAGTAGISCNCAAYSYALKGDVQGGKLALVKAGQ